MNKVKITAVRKTEYPDLMEKYENPILHTCDVLIGQSWISENGQRLREITNAVLTHKGEDIYEIMGSSIDALKFRSSMTLFDLVSPDNIFAEALDAFYSGQRDPRTIELVK